MLLSKRTKINVYPFEDLLGSSLAELFDKPNLWIALAFGVVTATFAVFVSMTCGDYVCWHSAGAIRGGDWNKMIGGYDMPESGAMTTVGTTSPKVIKTTLPVVGAKIVWQIVFAGASSSDIDLLIQFSFWGLSVSFTTLLIHIWIAAAVFTGVLPVALNTPKIHTAFVSFARAKVFKGCRKVALTLRAIFISLWRRRFQLAAFMGRRESFVTSTIFIKAWFATPAQSIFAVFISIKEFCATRVNLKTLSTAFPSGLHSAFLSLRSEDVIGRRRNYRFLGATLADGLIIPDNGACI